MTSSELQLVLFPPMGSDGRAFYRQRSLHYNIITPQPIDWRRGESMQTYAMRYFDHLVTTKQVDLKRLIVWGGLSLGGALAEEFSLIHRPLGLILLSSFRSCHELSIPVRSIGTIADRIPLGIFRIGGRIAPILMKAMGYMTHADIDLMIDGFRESDKRTFRNAFKALSKWEGVRSGLAISTLRIHGSKDPLIPIETTKGVIIALDTMHLITLSKPEDVNRSVAEFVDRLIREHSR